MEKLMKILVKRLFFILIFFHVLSCEDNLVEIECTEANSEEEICQNISSSGPTPSIQNNDIGNDDSQNNDDIVNDNQEIDNEIPIGENEPPIIESSFPDFAASFKTNKEILQFTEIFVTPDQGYCGITSNQDVHCWGSTHGLFGLKENAIGYFMGPLKFEIEPFSKMALSNYGVICYIDLNGNSKCKGDNSRKMISNDEVSYYSSPLIMDIPNGQSIDVVSHEYAGICFIASNKSATCYRSNYGSQGNDELTLTKTIIPSPPNPANFNRLGDNYCRLANSALECVLAEADSQSVDPEQLGPYTISNLPANTNPKDLFSIGYGAFACLISENSSQNKELFCSNLDNQDGYINMGVSNVIDFMVLSNGNNLCALDGNYDLLCLSTRETKPNLFRDAEYPENYSPLQFFKVGALPIGTKKIFFMGGGLHYLTANNEVKSTLTSSRLEYKNLTLKNDNILSNRNSSTCYATNENLFCKDPNGNSEQFMPLSPAIGNIKSIQLRGSGGCLLLNNGQIQCLNSLTAIFPQQTISYTMVNKNLPNSIDLDSNIFGSNYCSLNSTGEIHCWSPGEAAQHVNQITGAKAIQMIYYNITFLNSDDQLRSIRIFQQDLNQTLPEVSPMGDRVFAEMNLTEDGNYIFKTSTNEYIRLRYSQTWENKVYNDQEFNVLKIPLPENTKFVKSFYRDLCTLDNQGSLKCVGDGTFLLNLGIGIGSLPTSSDALSNWTEVISHPDIVDFEMSDERIILKIVDGSEYYLGRNYLNPEPSPSLYIFK